MLTYYTYYLHSHSEILRYSTQVRKSGRSCEGELFDKFGAIPEVAVPVEHLQFYYQKYYKKVGLGLGG